MTDWKMPNWIAEIYTQLSDAAFDREYHENLHGDKMSVFDDEVYIMRELRKHHLLSTPTERDDREKQIGKLKSALDNAEKENNAAWVLNEKLKLGRYQKRIEELEASLKQLHGRKFSERCYTAMYSKIKTLEARNRHLKALVEELKPQESDK